MIRVSVAFPTTDWPAVHKIRSAARGLSGLPGLIEVRVATREESGPGSVPTGPVAEILFDAADAMRQALEAEAWARLLAAAAGAAPVVHVYAIGGVVLAGRTGAEYVTTDIDLADEAVADAAEAEPLSTQIELPLSRPAPTDGDDEAAAAAS